MTEPEGLRALVYVSSARALLTGQELQQLLQRARANNEKERVTGVLLYCDGSFMQYIEGPADALERVYALIRSDRRHHGIVEIYSARVNCRAFNGWTMGYLPTHKADFVRLSRADWCGGSSSSPRQPGVGLQLLLDFWGRHHRNAPSEPPGGFGAGGVQTPHS
jgi:hypothetical protein